MKALPIVGFALMLIAGLLFAAGSPAMSIMPRNYANFLGMAVASAGVIVWVAYGVTRRQDDKDESE